VTSNKQLPLRAETGPTKGLRIFGIIYLIASIVGTIIIWLTLVTTYTTDIYGLSESSTNGTMIALGFGVVIQGIIVFMVCSVISRTGENTARIVQLLELEGISKNVENTTGKITTTLTSIVISPTNPPNRKLSFTQNFIATGYYPNGASADLSSLVTWESEDATIAAFIQPKSGMLNAISVGTVRITASYEGISSRAVNVTVIS
jgi:uncharacterized protein YjeT (DUF2065 family)